MSSLVEVIKNNESPKIYVLWDGSSVFDRELYFGIVKRFKTKYIPNATTVYYCKSCGNFPSLDDADIVIATEGILSEEIVLELYKRKVSIILTNEGNNNKDEITFGHKFLNINYTKHIIGCAYSILLDSNNTRSSLTSTHNSHSYLLFQLLKEFEKVISPTDPIEIACDYPLGLRLCKVYTLMKENDPSWSDALALNASFEYSLFLTTVGSMSLRSAKQELTMQKRKLSCFDDFINVVLSPDKDDEIKVYIDGGRCWLNILNNSNY